MNESERSPAPPRVSLYRSEAARAGYVRRLIAVLAVAFLFNNVLLPMALRKRLTEATLEKGRPRLALLQSGSGVWWRDALWLAVVAPSDSWGLFAGDRTGRNQLVRLTPEGPETMGTLSAGAVWLDPQEDRLRLFAQDGVADYDGERITHLKANLPAGRQGRPFLSDGRRCIPIETPEGWAAFALNAEGTAWERTAALNLPVASDASDAATVPLIVTTEAERFTFLRQAGHLLVRADAATTPEASAPAERWERLTPGEIVCWDAAVVDGRPLLLAAVTRRASPKDDPACTLAGYSLVDGVWRETLRADLDGAAQEIALTPNPSGKGAVALAAYHNWFWKRLELTAEGVTAQRSLNLAYNVPQSALLLTVVAGAVPYLVVFIAAAILSALMAACRTDTHAAPEKGEFASLAERSLARLADGALATAPFLGMVAALARLTPDASYREASAILWTASTLAAGGVVWMGLVLIGLILGEGVWGITPGKWLLGLRTVSVDLTPLGVRRATTRTLLLAVDLFFNGLVGVMLIAVNVNRQRLGDMAARSVVVRAASLPRPAPAPVMRFEA